MRSGIDPNAVDEPAATAPTPPSKAVASGSWTPTAEDFKSLRSVLLIGLISLAPAALLMFTSFIRINIVLILLRQAPRQPAGPRQPGTSPHWPCS